MGPLLDLELLKRSDTIPEGLRISPAHFLSAPEDERFRNTLEKDNHEHHIVKISQGDDGKLSFTKFGSFTRVTDSFCFETEDLNTFCFLTTAGDPKCEHGVSTTTAVIQREGMCPHEDGALESYVLCESKILDFKKEHNENIKILDSNTKRYHKLNQESKYKMEITPGDTRTSTSFNFMNLCKSNGEHYLGNYPRIIEGKNCKNNQKVTLNLMEWDNTGWDVKLSAIESIESCQHETECEFLVRHEANSEGTLPGSKQDYVPKSKDGSNSSNSTTTTNNYYINHAKNIGGIGGQNNENKIKSIKDGEEATLNGENSGVSEGNFFLSSQSLIIIIAFLVIVIAVLLYK